MNSVSLANLPGSQLVMTSASMFVPDLASAGEKLQTSCPQLHRRSNEEGRDGPLAEMHSERTKVLPRKSGKLKDQIGITGELTE